MVKFIPEHTSFIQANVFEVDLFGAEDGLEVLNRRKVLHQVINHIICLE